MAFVVANAAKTAFNTAKNKTSGIGKTLKNRAYRAMSAVSRKNIGPEVPITTPETKSHTLVVTEGLPEPSDRLPSASSEPVPSSSSAPMSSGSNGGNSIPVEGMVGDMYPRLKECLCESLARMFTDASPKLIDVAIQTVEKKINTDPQIRQYIDARVKSISDDILRTQETKDTIIASLTDNCKRPTIAVAGGGRKTRRRIQERSGRTLFGRISNNIPENDVGVCRNIGRNSKKYTRFVYKKI